MATNDSEKIGLDGSPIAQANVPSARVESSTSSPIAKAEVATESTRPAALGSKTYLDLNLASHHFVDKNDKRHRVWNGHESMPYNQKNLGLGVTHMKEVWQSAGGSVTASLGGSVGYYYNSMYRDSVYATANGEITHKVTPTVGIGVGAQVGVVSGYNKGVVPAGQVYARIEKEFGKEIAGVKSVFAQFGVIPAVNAKQVSTPATATVRVGISF